jgi:TonB family protein
MKRARVVPWMLALVALLLARRASADQIAADKLPETPAALPADKAEAQYLRGVHAHVHKRWADNFLRLSAEKLPANNPLNQPGLNAEVDLVVTADGQLMSAKVARSSGFAGFDDAVIEVLRDAVPFPLPPPAIRSDDDKMHLHWVFARDQRRCAGLNVVRTYEPVNAVLPKLLRSGRRDEALKRVAMARSAGVPADPAFTLLASDWIKATLHEPWATIRQAESVAALKDDAGVAWLKNALRRPELAGEAGVALVALKVPVCPLVKNWFDSQTWTDHETAAVALATSPDPACAPGLMALLQNAKARPEARAAAAVALGPIDDAEARKLLATTAKEEKNAKVRAAAMLAQVRPNAGRSKVVAVVPFLRDPSPDIRSAAAAVVVRAGGDANLEDLYVLFKDTDQRAALATLREIERVRSEPATELISRLAKRPFLAVQKLAAQMLIRRGARDHYLVLRPYLDAKVDPELRGLALVTADEPAMQAAAADPTLGINFYRARLARGERDKAADWFIARGASLPPPTQVLAMLEWLASAPAEPATAAVSKPAPAKKAP